MSIQDLAGFRRLRTISQLTFETMLQIILQLRILLYTQNTNSDSTAELEIDKGTVMLSLALAIAHLIIEIAFIILESKSTKTTFMHYSIVCFNGRFGWVPFTN